MTEHPTVLIIDDSHMNLSLLSQLLTQDNFDVLVADNGQTGLQIAKQTPPDIILLDVIMPEWDGYETCHHIKNEPTLAHIPIIFLSAYNDTEKKVHALKSGGVDYISKPYQKEELLARIHTHLNLAHSHQNLERDIANKTEQIKTLLLALQHSYEKSQESSIVTTDIKTTIPSHSSGLDEEIQLAEKETILNALKQTKGHTKKTAQLLNIGVGALRYRIQKYHIVLQDFSNSPKKTRIL